MSAMAKLRPAVDAFFDKVKVNDDDAKVRENRLKLSERNPRRDACGGGFFQDPGLRNDASAGTVMRGLSAYPSTRMRADGAPALRSKRDGSAGQAR